MFTRAVKYFKKLAKSEEYNFTSSELVNSTSSIKNVWCWSPDDISQITVIKSPLQPYQEDGVQGGEAIWVMYENWNQERVANHWYCQEEAELTACLNQLKKEFL